MSGVRRLITDADVLAGRVTSPIVLDEGTVITPAARDRALSRGITVVERDAPRPAGQAAAAAPPAPGVWQPRAASPTCGGCGGCPSCAPAGNSSLDGLPDGSYLVIVRDGRAVSIHPNTGPGLVPRRP